MRHFEFNVFLDSWVDGFFYVACLQDLNFVKKNLRAPAVTDELFCRSETFFGAPVSLIYLK